MEKWMEYRKDSGEKVDENSWVMRQLWTGHYHHGRKKSDLKRNKYEFQTNHGLRKWFKTRCEQSGMKSINIETLMGHSIGISDSYYRINEKELLDDYLKAVGVLTIKENNILQRQATELSDRVGKLDMQHPLAMRLLVFRIR